MDADTDLGGLFSSGFDGLRQLLGVSEHDEIPRPLFLNGRVVQNPVFMPTTTVDEIEGDDHAQ